jgi:hypothetical protein
LKQRLNSFQPIGDVVIRPSRLGTHQLTITWKFAEEIFVHIAVAEHDKPNEVSKALGRRLSIENEQFEGGVFAALNAYFLMGF